MRVTVFTAMVGETDALLPPTVVDPDARYLCFSDRRTAVPPYEWIRVKPSSTPRLASRRIKILADHPALRDAEATLWHDASYRLMAGTGWVVRRLRKYDIVGLFHPKRTLIEDEGQKIASYGYLSAESAEAHVTRYRAAGFLAVGITTGGLLGRRVSPEIARFNALWWREAQAWGGRDQASLDYAAFVTHCSIGHVKGSVKHNKFACWRQLEEVPV